jgi:COP9 signalosome complex subunit 3
VDEAHSLEALEQQIKRIVSLNNQVKAMDKKLTLTHEYQTYRVNSATGGLRVPGKGHPMDVEMLDMGYGGGGWGDDDVDETVMDYDEV